MADFWIKAYHEILDDPKMATMPDRLWRRTMEIFLLAGKLSRDRSGELPETNQLAWLLRMSSDDLLMDLKQLESIGILQRVGDGWLVRNFEKRQAAVTSTERSQQHRERKQKDQYYGNDSETQMQRNVAQINRLTDTETESDIERDNARASDSNPSTDPFDILLTEIESVIGLPQGADVVKTIQELISIGAEACDIQEAADWYRSNGKTIHSAKSLIGPVKTALMKRKQQARAPALEKSGKSKNGGGPSALERMKKEEMEKYDAIQNRNY